MKLRRWVGQKLPRDSRSGHWLRRTYSRLLPRSVRMWHLEVLNGFASGQGPARFVQVGSNDAGYDDPLRYYTLHHGWRGLMIEPLPHVFKRLKVRYQDMEGLEFANVAIDREAGERLFYHLRPSNEPDLPPWYDMLGSFILENLLRHKRYLPDLPERITTTTVRCATFDQVCAEHGIEDFDLLHIDAEGYDYQILNTVDLHAYRPKLVLYENRHLSDDEYQASLGKLHDAGYITHSDQSDTIAVSMDTLETNQPLAHVWLRLRRIQNTDFLAKHSGERWPEVER